MLKKKQPHRPRIAAGTLISSCLALTLTLVFFLFPANTPAYASTITTSGPALQVNAGFNARYRDGNWVPIQVILSNNGADFNGTLSISAPSPFAGQGNFSASSTYTEPITLANGAQKQITMYIPLNFGAQGSTQTINVDLLDGNGNTVRRQTSTLTSLGQNDIFAGVLSDQNTGFSPLYSISLPNQGGSMIVETLNAGTLPVLGAVLKNFDLIILDNFTTSNLNAAQLTALQTWVNQGGALIEAGGPEWRRTLSALPPALLPVTINGTRTLPAGTRLLPAGGSGMDSNGQDSVNAPIIVSAADLNPAGNGNLQNAAILSSDTTPLIVQSHQGQGSVCYLAFDPTLAPIVTWPSAGVLWEGLVLRALGDKLLNSSSTYMQANTFQTAGLGGLLQNFLSNNLPSPWLLLILLLGYLVILGPVRLLIVRWRKKRDWNWRIVLSSIVVFSLLTYGLAIEQKGTDILSNSVSIIRLNQGGSSAHVTTYVGVFVPNQGDYQVHIPGSGLVQPSTDQSGPNTSSGQQTIITAEQSGTDVNLQGVNIWTLRSLLAERDHQVQGGITSQLTLDNGLVTGTVTNAFNYPLRDVYVLMTNSFARIGDLPAGQSKQVQLTLKSSTGNTNISLADQIAQSYQLPIPYAAIASSSGSSPQNELQRHLAILSALSGEEGFSFCKFGSCNGMTGVSSSAPIVNGGPGLATTNGSDPLLIAGSPATLIGWADQSTDTTNNVTINGASPSGIQETLLQAPLAVNLSGTSNLPPGFITGQLIDVQGHNVQIQPGGAYTMTTGSVTFEFPVPGKLQASNLTLSEPANLAQVPGTPTVDASHLQAHLYNWQTRSWDAIKLSGLSFSTANADAYIDQGGRVLLKLGNSDSSVGTIFFGKPSLNLQGSIT